MLSPTKKGKKKEGGFFGSLFGKKTNPGPNSTAAE